MRGSTSIFVVGTVACVVSVVGVASHARSEGGRPIAAASAAVPTQPTVQMTDSVRREQLNLRLQSMLREGKGSRLTEPASAGSPAAAPTRPRRASTPTPPPAKRVTTPKPVSMPEEAERSEFSTITPPAYRGGPIRTASGGRYVPPRLDLRTPPRIPTNDIECLTQAIYYEARNESEEGQAAVAEVVLNRSRAGGYPRDVCQVVYQRNSRTCQFTFTCDGSIGRSPINMRAWGRAERIARGVYEGHAPALLPTTSVNYHANYVRPSWGRRLARVRQIGAHIFYGAPLGGGSTPGAERAAPEPSRAGLTFVRNEALDRAYAAVMAGANDADGDS